jgi:polysaccharide export outer membrane protein
MNGKLRLGIGLALIFGTAVPLPCRAAGTDQDGVTVDSSFAGSSRAPAADPVRAPSVPEGPGSSASVDRGTDPNARTDGRKGESGSASREGAAPAQTGQGVERTIPRAWADGSSGATGLASTDAPALYRIGTGDLIHVSVWQEPDASGDFKVSAQGTIQHYLIGQVGVAGHTVGEIAEVIRNALAMGYMRNPRVSVQVLEYNSQKVYVYGEVRRPGVYALRGNTDLLKLLLDAGGPTPAAGGGCTLLQIRKTPRGDEVHNATVDLDDLLMRGDLTQNASVSSGTVVFVHGEDEGNPAQGAASEGKKYYVLGEVKNPGAYKYKTGISAMTAILEAGGFSEFARSNKTKLVREKDGNKETKIVKMGDIFGEGDRSKDVELEPGDVLVVPKSLF